MSGCRCRRTCRTGGRSWSRPAPPIWAGCRPTATTSRPRSRSRRPHQVRKELAPRGYALTERLCVYPQYMDPEWMEQGVLDVIKLKYWSFIPRRGSGRRSEEVDRRRTWPRRRSPRAARGWSSDRGRADRAVRRDPPGGDRGDAGRCRRAAGGAGGRPRHLRRQPQHQLHQRLRRRLRLLRVRAGQALARRLRSLRGGLRGADRARRSSSAPPSSACRAASIPT